MWWGVIHDTSNDDTRDIDAIKYAYDTWIRSFDSAEMYAQWYAETLLWRALTWKNRQDLFISTKVRGDNCSYSGIKNACHDSLKRLAMEYIDLYYVHWNDWSYPMQETMRALNELVDEWKIKYIWVSNFTKESLEQAQNHSKYHIVANQVHYNLIFREPDRSGLTQYCSDNDIMLVAWRPFEYGNFQNPENLDILTQMSEKYNKTPFQIALNWIMSHKRMTTLFMSTTPSNIDQNLWALGWEMSQEDYAYLKDSFPWQRDISDAVPLG